VEWCRRNSIGLVDSSGGLTDAIKEAALLAGLEEYRTIEKPDATDFYTKLLKDLTETMRNESHPE
jgi:ClpP class serine protease